MSTQESTPTQELKVVILAAGEESISAAPILLQQLGDRKVIDHVLQNARQVASADDIYIVVGYHHEEMRAHLGAGYEYINQDKQLGTGHAVLQLRPLLKDFHGNLLILYGDTPL